MGIILHLSDFHVKKVYENHVSPETILEDEEYLPLKNLAEFLYDREISVDYLVHTGDLVDKDAKEGGFRTAQIYLKDFLTRIRLTDNARIIICHGNHDTDRSQDGDRTLNNGQPCCHFENPNGHVFFKTVPQQGYRDLLHALGVTDYYKGVDGMDDDGPWLVDRGKLKFLILNSDWKVTASTSPNQYDRNCVNCYGLEKILEKNRDTRFVVVSHQPKRSLCESFLSNYVPGIECIYQQMEDGHHILMWLAGDLHTATHEKVEDHTEIICGGPLAEKKMRYALISYDDDNSDPGSVFVEYLIYNSPEAQNKWSFKPDTKTVERFYELCKRHVTHWSYAFLDGKDSHTFQNLPSWLDTKKLLSTNDRMGWISTIFGTISRYRV